MILARKLLLAGFLANVGFGPASLYLMRLNLTRGFGYSWKLVGAIMLSDVFYALIALLASSWVQPLLIQRKELLLFGLGIFLLYLSWHLWRQDKHHEIHLKKKKKTHSAWKDFFHIFMIVLFHPGVLLMYLGLFTALGIVHRDVSMVLLVVMCVSIGALVWYMPLLWITSKAKRHSSEKTIHHIVQGLTAMIFLLGCYVFIDLLFLHIL